MYCHQCGKEVDSGRFCPYCGASLDGAAQQQYQQQYQPINSYSREQDESSIGFSILSFLVPIVGLILYLVWHKEYPKKAKSCLKGIITGIILYATIACCVLSLTFGMLFSGESRGTYYEYEYDYGTFNSVVQTIPNE